MCEILADYLSNETYGAVFSLAMLFIDLYYAVYRCGSEILSLWMNSPDIKGVSRLKYRVFMIMVRSLL